MRREEDPEWQHQRRIEAYQILDAMKVGEWVQARDLVNVVPWANHSVAASPAARLATRLRWLRDHDYVSSRHGAPDFPSQRSATEWCITEIGRARRTLNARFGMPVRSPRDASEVARGEEGLRQGSSPDAEPAGDREPSQV